MTEFCSQTFTLNGTKKGAHHNKSPLKQAKESIQAFAVNENIVQEVIENSVMKSIMPPHR